jgi:dethiobiotin synthetase
MSEKPPVGRCQNPVITKSNASELQFEKPPRGIFVAGTDTEVGKTYVSILIVKALVAAGHQVGVYKPAASDCVSDGKTVLSEDALTLWQAAGQPLTLEKVCPQPFRAALAPPLAARAEGRAIDSQLLRTGISEWCGHCDVVVVEGAGGLMSPITNDEYVADLAVDFGYAMVVVAPNVLGAINQTLQTLFTACCFRDGIEVAGVVLNDAQSFQDDISMGSNFEEIAARIRPPVLAHVHYESQEFEQNVDWFALAEVKKQNQA